MREDLRETWDETRTEVREAAEDVGRSAHQSFEQAVEVGAMIGDAIADRLPPGPTAAAQKKGLDLRWLHLNLNIPAVIIAGAAWWGVGPADGLTDSVRTDGAAAPLGWVLLVVLLAGVLMLLPLGSALAGAVAHLVTALSGVLWQGLVRAWRARYLGYLLRLVVAVVAWVVIIGFARLVWRALLTWLTGV
ncbi:hypothetical protein ACGFWI_37830 [Streptomyces sp. NPDC048434]|uniref:hypothetical protein n=1 Tax=Streptomyces sp. NPDC048434 TaxID=3365549 RepID=UPI00371E6C0C